MAYNSKTIAKNTASLYVRTIIVLLISLYTSRVFLDALGVIDFGTYSAVGGVVGMISFLNSTLAAATSRYLTFELGKGDTERLKKTFNVSLSVHILLILFIVLILETIGLWYINNKLNLPDPNMAVVNIVFQLSVLACVFQIFVIPFNASIIAHEKMNVFALIGIMDAVLKLIIAFAIYHSPINRLVFYSGLLLGITIIDAIVYVIYCKTKFEECTIKLCFDKKILRPMLVFSGWGFYGNFSVVVRNQGLVLIQNSFFGPIVNAATTISNQVMTAIMGFVDNFTTAVKPQIIKQYAQGAVSDFNNLVVKASKYSFLLLLFISMPVMAETDFLLNVWLKEVPDWAVIFCQLSIANNWISILFRPLQTAIDATGVAKYSALVNGSIYLLTLPLSYFFLKLGGTPVVPLIINIVLLFIGHSFGTINIIRYLIPTFDVKAFLRESFLPAFYITLIAAIPPFLINFFMDEGWVRFLIDCGVTIIWIGIIIYFMALKQSERARLGDYVGKVLHKRPL